MTFDFTPFDLQRMFLWDADLLFLLEIVVRVLIIFIYALILLRLLWNEGMKNMSFLDYFLVIALWSASWDPMFYPSVPIMYALVVITVVIGFREAISRLTLNSEIIQNFIQAKPALIIDKWELDKDMMKQKKLTRETLFSQLRIEWIENTWTVKCCYLEPNGDISVFCYESWKEKNGISVLPPKDLEK